MTSTSVRLAIVFLAASISASADITVYTDHSDAVAALNARQGHEAYTAVPLTRSDIVPPRRRAVKPLNYTRLKKGGPVARSKIAVVIDGKGRIIDQVPFDYNDRAYGDAVASVIAKMIILTPGTVGKKPANFVLVYRYSTEDPTPEVETQAPKSRS